MKIKRDKVVVTERALLRRINRLLRKQKKPFQVLRRRRHGGRPHPDEKTLGRYFVVGDEKVVERKFDITKFARAHALLHEHEAVESP